MSSDIAFDMRGSGPDGSHTVRLPDGELSVEWYDFADRAPYESLNYLYFDRAACDALARAMGLAPGGDRELLARVICERFDSYFSVRRFVDSHGLTYRHRVNFWP
jgi:hypothetical protein